MLPQQLRRATQTVVYRIASAYGFQLFNYDLDSQEWVTATAGLAADQLLVLLRDAALRKLPELLQQQAGPLSRSRQQGLQQYIDAWKHAISTVHSEYFQEYNLWLRNVNLDEPEAQKRNKQLADIGGYTADNKVLLQLLELSLQFCIYTEGANLRHTPDLLCLVYYIMRSSPHFQDVLRELAKVQPPPQQQQQQQQQQDPQPSLPHTHWQYWLLFSAEDFPVAAMKEPRKEDSQDGQGSTQVTGDDDGASSSKRSNNNSSSDAAAAAACGGGGAATGQQQQAPADILAGACDITMLRRSLVQQLYDAAVDAFTGPLASSVKTNPPQEQQQQQQQPAEQGLPSAKDSAERAVQGKKQLQNARAAILARVGRRHRKLVEQLLAEIEGRDWLRDQQQFLFLVVQPLFFFLAEQIDLAGQQMEEEPALRIAYDDVNEHCCSPSSVKKLLKVLRESVPETGGQGRSTQPADDLWSALREALYAHLGGWRQQDKAQGQAKKVKQQPDSSKEREPDPVITATSRYPRDFRREDVLRRMARELHKRKVADGNAGNQAGAAQVPTPAATKAPILFDPKAPIKMEPISLDQVYEFSHSGADWWAKNMFRHKTFVETRSAASPFVAFWRVYCFHAVLLTVMGALAYVWETRHQQWPWGRYAAAFLLTTVTDALMRAARAGAYFVLAMYTVRRVKRKVRTYVRPDAIVTKRGWFTRAASNLDPSNASRSQELGRPVIRDVIVKLDPFPPGSVKQLCLRLMQLLFWAAWAGFIGIFLAMQVTEEGNEGFIELMQRNMPRTAARYRFASFVAKFWLLPALVHIVVVWGAGLLRQRHGYVAKNIWQGLHAMPSHLSAFCSGDQTPPPAPRGAYASCSSDPKVDALFFPASNLRTDRKRSLANLAMWVAVIVVKVAFELLLVIIPLVRMMRKLLESTLKDFLQKALQLQPGNQPPAGEASKVLVLVALTAPVILMSFSDTGMFFSVVGALVSAGRAFKRAVGSIKHWSDMVQGFVVLQHKYMKHCMSHAAMQLHVKDRGDPNAIQEAAVCAMAAGWNALVLDLRQRDLLCNREMAVLMFEQLQLTHTQKMALLGDDYLKPLKLTTMLPARCFLAGAVGDLASGVVGTPHHLWVAQVVWSWLLWVMWQTGLLHTQPHLLLEGSTASAEKKEKAHKAHQAAKDVLRDLTRVRLLYPVQLQEQPARWEKMLSEVVKLLQLLSKSSTKPSNLGAAAAELLRSQGCEGDAAGGKQPEGLLHGLPLKQKDVREKARDLSHHMNNLINLLAEELEDVRQHTRSMNAINMSETELNAAENSLKTLKNHWGDSDKTATKEEGRAWLSEQSFASVSEDAMLPMGDKLEKAVEYIAMIGRASDGPAQVVQYLTDVLTMYEGDTQPADEEAVRFLLGFASSLKDPGLGVAPSLQECPTLSTLVPHYNEDVLYALSEDDALQDLQVAKGSKLDEESQAEMLYLMSPEGSSTPTLSYLRSVYNTNGETHTQWANFVERIMAVARARGMPVDAISSTVYEYHFLPGGPLHPLKQELLLWASWRGQLLARTVRGLMSYRTALQALARHENPHFLHLGLELVQQAADAPPQQPQQRQQPAAPAQQRSTGLFRSFLGFGRSQQQQQQQQPPEPASPAPSPREQRRPLQTELDELEDQQRLLVNTQRQLKAQQEHNDKQLKAEEGRLKDVVQEQATLQQQDQSQPEVRRSLRELQRQLERLKRLKDMRTERKKGLEQDLNHTKEQLKQVRAELQKRQEPQRFWEALRDVLLDDLVDSKYHLVVSSQNLGLFTSELTDVRLGEGDRKKNLKSAWLAHSVGVLRQKHPTFKVAFIDRQLLVTASRPGHKVELFRHASVLLTSHHQQQLAAEAGLPCTQQAYRVLLPVNFESARGVVLGEGKPENQNHAIVFCPGEALQTIDCNQDNIVAEGLKLRNLLAELQKPSEKQVALVGFREWIFSEDSGVIAEFAAATERSFGTTVQRLMYNPGAVRFHYGHPDVWRRSFVSTCGGVSKANKALHVSEDVFGGYNVILRGREIKYVDYIAVGKGRDMSFETVLTFEAKIAAGNGEQVLSRDVRRLGHNMSFARLMTWYHTGNGFFINTALNMVSVHVSLWAYLLLALGKYQNQEVQASLSAVQLLQLGSLSTLVYLFTLGVEIGMFKSVWTIVRQMLQGSLMFFIFRAQTSAYSFTYDLLFGGAKYLATGRGYKLAPTSFKDLYRRFGRSHFYFGAVLLQYAVACFAAGHEQGLKLLVLWGPLLVVLSLLFGPFWFTPFAFRTSNVKADFKQMQAWFSSPSPKPENSWCAWNEEAWRAASNADGKQLGRFGAALRAVLFKLPTFLLLLAVASRMKRPPAAKPFGFPNYAVGLIIAASVLGTTSLLVIIKYLQARTALQHHSLRLASMLITFVLVVGVLASGIITSDKPEQFLELRTSSNTALVAFGTVLLLRLLPLSFYIAPKLLGPLCSSIYYVADVVLTFFLNCLRFVLSLFDILTGLQAQLLFNTAYARQVMADTTLQLSVLPKLVKQALQQQYAARKRLVQAAVQQAQQ